jgi:hypothetical protein
LPKPDQLINLAASDAEMNSRLSWAQQQFLHVPYLPSLRTRHLTGPEWWGADPTSMPWSDYDAFVHRACAQDVHGGQCRDRANEGSALIPPCARGSLPRLRAGMICGWLYPRVVSELRIACRIRPRGLRFGRHAYDPAPMPAASASHRRSQRPSPELGNRVGEVALFCGATHGGPVQGDAKKLVRCGHVAMHQTSVRYLARLGASSTILIDLPLIWMQQKRSRSPVRTHMPFLQP